MQSVKAVERLSTGNEAGKRKRRDRDKQWSLRFLELLIDEIEQEEWEKEKNKHQRHKMRESKNEEVEYDCRIVRRGEENVPADWDSFEMSGEYRDDVLESELYENIFECVKTVGNLKANVLYQIALAVMHAYYQAGMDTGAVGELFVSCFRKCLEKNEKLSDWECGKVQVLSSLYEFFLRANAWKAVLMNEKEGKELIQKHGLEWYGTTYYNSKFYYEAEQLQQMLRRKVEFLKEQYGIESFECEKIEQNSIFRYVGGVGYHEVFVWLQRKVNHPETQYGMRKLKEIPPRDFVFLYRNHCIAEESEQLLNLERSIKQKIGNEANAIFRSFKLESGREYHNGMSYLLEGNIENDVDEKKYAEGMRFLQNFILYRKYGCAEYFGMRIK